jgi:precorrin-6A synthase
MLAAGTVAFEYRVVPGVTSVQALAARHRVPLHGIGEPVHITTGRRLGDTDDEPNTVVMLDGAARFAEVDPEGVEIFWGANLGTDREEAIAGPLGEVAGQIEERRAALRAAVGWVMDVYLLRRAPTGSDPPPGAC